MCQFYVDASYVAFFRKIQPVKDRYVVSSPCLRRVGGGYNLSFSIRNIIIFFVKGVYRLQKTGIRYCLFLRE